MALSQEVIENLSVMLDGVMILAGEDDELYLTTPIHGGAIEIDSDGAIYYREWLSNGGIYKEEKIGTLPDVPSSNYPAWIRVMLKQEENRRNIESGASEPLIYRECKIAQLENREISDAAAREISHSWYWWSANHRDFACTGVIRNGDLWREMFGFADGTIVYNSLSDDDKLAADMLGTYIVQRILAGQTGPVENWSNLRLDKP